MLRYAKVVCAQIRQVPTWPATLVSTMAARSIGSGTISFGLVSIPFKLYTAASPVRASFNMLHAACGGRVKQQLHCPTCNVVVERGDIEKGYEFQKDQYVRFKDEEIKALESARTGSLELVEFVDEEQIDAVYVDKSYFLGPDKGGERAYRLLAESLQRTGKVAVGKHFARGREQLVLVRAYKDGLIMNELHYANEVRDFADVETGGKFEFKPVEQELADKLIEQLSVEEWKPEQFSDAYQDRVKAAVEQKVAGEEVTVTEEAPKAQIIDLLEALKRSLGAPAASANAATEEAPPSSKSLKPPKKATPRRAKSSKTGTE